MQKSDDPSTEDELASLRAEVERLRQLVGPSEHSYIDLQLALLGAKDAVIGAEAELGTMRGSYHALGAEVIRARRDQEWLREQVMIPMRKLRSKSPTLAKVVRRLSK
jgi:hypothetical protein